MDKDKKLKILEKIPFYFTYFLRLTLIVAIVLEIFNQRWPLFFITSLILLLTYLPFFIEKKYRIDLPLEFEFVIILFIYASLFLGEVRSYYTKLLWWDILLHAGFGIAMGFAGFLIMYILYYKNKIETKPIWIIVFSFCFAVAIGTLWEIFEFGMDQIFRMNMQKSGLVDTMWDLIVNSFGALFISFVGYFYIRRKKTPIFSRMLNKFVRKNQDIFKKNN